MTGTECGDPVGASSRYLSTGRSTTSASTPQPDTATTELPDANMHAWRGAVERKRPSGEASPPILAVFTQPALKTIVTKDG